MQKKVIQIKEINTIEGELNNAPVGVVAFRIEDNIVQRTKTFIYLDKNIYIFFGQGDEEFKKIKFDRKGSFSILKNLNEDSNLTYRILSITVTGKIRLIDDQKMFEDIGKAFMKKYKWKKLDSSFAAGAVIIDTEEMQAYEESGG